ncbi:hypothetical protein PAMP_018614 [Pampus punctatissimus]
MQSKQGSSCTTMDRVKSSMQQVPNAIPKVIRRTGGANSLELEKENFERGQAGCCYAVEPAASCLVAPPSPLPRPGTGERKLQNVGNVSFFLDCKTVPELSEARDGFSFESWCRQ